MLRKKWILIFTLILASQSSYGWQPGKTEHYPLDCSDLIVRGAEQVNIQITAEAGSYGMPYLVGMKEDTEIWRHRFPADEVNLAKFDCSCEGNTITLSSADPGPNKPHYQMFIWNGAIIEGRIQFAKGTDNWGAYRKTLKNQKDHFTLWAKKGQRIEIKAKTQFAPSIFSLSVHSPKSRSPLYEVQFGEQDVAWSAVLDKTGEYKIAVSATADNAYYYLRVRIP